MSTCNPLGSVGSTGTPPIGDLTKPWDSSPQLPPKPVIVNYGWLCPRCGRGNSPYLTTCPCLPIPKLYVPFNEAGFNHGTNERMIGQLLEY